MRTGMELRRVVLQLSEPQLQALLVVLDAAPTTLFPELAALQEQAVKVQSIVDTERAGFTMSRTWDLATCSVCGKSVPLEEYRRHPEHRCSPADWSMRLAAIGGDDFGDDGEPLPEQP